MNIRTFVAKSRKWIALWENLHTFQPKVTHSLPASRHHHFLLLYSGELLILANPAPAEKFIHVICLVWLFSISLIWLFSVSFILSKMWCANLLVLFLKRSVRWKYSIRLCSFIIQKYKLKQSHQDEILGNLCLKGIFNENIQCSYVFVWEISNTWT